MLIADIPNALPSAPQAVMVAQGNTGQQIAKDGHVLGVCDVVNVNGTGQANADPVILANAYFRTHDATINSDTAKVSILQQPKHGSLEPDSRGDWRYAIYIPNDGYLGDDAFVMQVEGSGYTVKLQYYIAVTDDWGVSANPNPICKGPIWKISQDANDSKTYFISFISKSFSYQPNPPFERDGAKARRPSTLRWVYSEQTPHNCEAIAE